MKHVALAEIFKAEGLENGASWSILGPMWETVAAGAQETG